MATKKRTPAKKAARTSTSAAEARRRANTAADKLGNGLAGRARDAVRARQRALDAI